MWLQQTGTKLVMHRNEALSLLKTREAPDPNLQAVFSSSNFDMVS